MQMMKLAIASALALACSAPQSAPSSQRQPAITMTTKPPEPTPPATPAPMSATANVGIFVGGPLPVDANGNVHATVHVVIDARVALTGVALADLELTDDNHTIIARGTPNPSMRVMAEPPSRDLGPFDGTIAAGGHVAIWTGARLDAPMATLTRTPPTRYRLRIASGSGSIVVTGEMMKPGATG